jgi:hypothetical protein
MSLESWLDDSSRLLPASLLDTITVRVARVQPLNRAHAKKLIIDWIDEGLDSPGRKRTVALHLKLAWRKRISKLEAELSKARSRLSGL